MRARVGDAVKLRRDFGAEIAPGDVLETTTGRQYLVREVHGRALHCVVVKGLQATLQWTWSKRL